MKILLVDDSRTITLLLQVYLMGMAPEFLEARTGQDGLALAKRERPDLIITDVQMPGEPDGFGVCAAVRADLVLRDTPVLLLTSQADEAAQRRGREVGATAFLSKPVSRDQLTAAVRAALARPRQGHD